jgi:hypothetical protein
MRPLDIERERVLGMADLQVSESVAAAPDTVYRLISDVTRMGEWSPEATGGRWLKGASGAAVGAQFKGSNRHGWRRWSSKCTVTDADPGKRFAFRVTYGPATVAFWDYTIEPTPDGCVVTEHWTDHRPGLLKTIYPMLMGIPDRVAANHTNMQTTLRKLKEAAET